MSHPDKKKSYFPDGLFFLVGFLAFISFPVEAAVKKYQFNILVKNISTLCHAKPTVTVNGRFPGPTIYAREGDSYRQCHKPHVHSLVESGKTYLLRIINAALNDDLFFAISGHNMMLVEVDAHCSSYTSPITGFQRHRFRFELQQKAKFPAIVPLKVDRKLSYTVGFGKDLCTTCVKGTRLLASLNNISFVMPKMGLLQAHYFNTKRAFRIDFPDKPPKPFNDTGAPLTADLGTAHGTRLSKFAFNSTVELALQDTNLLKVESHPFHLHGCNFFVIGTWIGNFDPVKDPSKFNLVDPIERNTVGILLGVGPPFGVWFMHCHLELDNGWGLKMAFVVEDGTGADQ
ncbi:hypothetical protein Goari_014264 [Gossypium aridum]|uniref:Laccase n=1 Tax=Gossypium aridum TaxID=34290 RepID=A0A7J8XHA3_GOSAI|nr:hypothetical protein [Gossypium aridum]